MTFCPYTILSIPFCPPLFCPVTTKCNVNFLSVLFLAILYMYSITLSQISTLNIPELGRACKISQNLENYFCPCRIITHNWRWQRIFHAKLDEKHFEWRLNNLHRCQFAADGIAEFFDLETVFLCIWLTHIHKNLQHNNIYNSAVSNAFPFST